MQYSNYEYQALLNFITRNVKPLPAQQVHIAASGSVLRKFFHTCCNQQIRAKARTEKVVSSGLEAIPSVPELRLAVGTKESDNILNKSACTDRMACGSRSRSTDEHSQSATTSVDTCVVRGVAKQQQSSSRAAAGTAAGAAAGAAAKQQQSSKATSSKAAAK